MLKALPLPESPFHLYRELARRHGNTFLFESIEGPERLARFSILGFNPEGFVELRDGHLRITGNLPSPEEDEDIFRYLRGARATIAAASADDTRDPLSRGLPFDGGFVGFFSYDLVREVEHLPHPPRDDENYPDLQLGLYLDGVVYDHLARQGWYFTRGRDRSDAVVAAARAAELPRPPTRLKVGTLEPNLPKERFAAMVERAKRYVKEGDVFQVVLSKRLRAPFEGDVMGFYESLRATNPSPYMYCLNFGERHVIGSSPEMLVRVTGDLVETFPIAGTRAVTPDAKENDRLAAELAADEKEIAEHTMLVDLARNDVGRVSVYGTVRVTDLARVERYSHVQHLVSRVVGRLRPGVDALDALAALFPAGTVSGAPKVRAMEIIDELEPTRRGPYAGAVGYLSLRGDLDTAITIRTLTATHSHVSIQTGAGIVADSRAEREWTETEEKARALVAALGGNGEKAPPAGAEAARSGSPSRAAAKRGAA